MKKNRLLENLRDIFLSMIYLEKKSKNWIFCPKVPALAKYYEPKIIPKNQNEKTKNNTLPNK